MSKVKDIPVTINDKDEKRVTTLNVSEDDFQKIDITKLPAGWNYIQGKTPSGSIKHSFRRKWIMDLQLFRTSIIPSLDTNTKDSLMMGSWVIADQNRQKANLATLLGIVGNNAEQKALLKAAQRMVTRGHCKTIEEALKQIG